MQLSCLFSVAESSLEVESQTPEIQTEADTIDVTDHSHVDGLMLYVCTVCHRGFKQRRHLTAHRKRHVTEDVYSSSQFEKHFSSQSSLSEHMSTHRDIYKCTECGICCQSSRALAEHRRSHSGQKPFECTVCSKQFAKSSHLVNHSRIHSGEKPYKCLLCDKAFIESKSLRRHIRVHTGEKAYTCYVCGSGFSRSEYLESHMRIHTGESPYKVFSV